MRYSPPQWGSQGSRSKAAVYTVCTAGADRWTLLTFLLPLVPSPWMVLATFKTALPSSGKDLRSGCQESSQRQWGPNIVPPQFSFIFYTTYLLVSGSYMSPLFLVSTPLFSCILLPFIFISFCLFITCCKQTLGDFHVIYKNTEVSPVQHPSALVTQTMLSFVPCHLPDGILVLYSWKTPEGSKKNHCVLYNNTLAEYLSIVSSHHKQ